jgi:D-alanine transaminase/branched-chain amino acid aminotransferase
MMESICFLNNRFLEYRDAQLHVSDLGLQRGYGIFDYFIEMDGRIPFYDDYLDRFYHSARLLNLDVPLTRDLLKEKIAFLLEQNKLKTSGIRLLLTGGYSEDMYTPARPNFMILNLPLHHHPSEYTEGVKLLLLEYQRYHPAVKSTFYLPSIVMIPELKKRGAIEVLYHHQGFVYETTRANFFMVKNNKLITPSCGVLPGIIRKHVLQVAAGVLPVEERKIRLEELWDCDEAFITGTSKHVAPVLEVDGRITGKGKPGKVTMEIREAFEQYFLLQK